MSENYRINVNLINKSFTVGQDVATGMGATVIPADKGPMTPVKLNRGETEKIRMLFGANRYETLEAIAYNNKYPLWISAPHSGGAFASLLLTDTGLKPVPLSFSGDPETLDFTNLCYQYKLGTGNGETQSFGIGNIPSVVVSGGNIDGLPTKAKIIIDNKEYDAQLTWTSATDYTLTFEAGTGLGTIADNKFTVNLDFATPPAKGSVLLFKIYVNTSNLLEKVYAVIGMKFPCEDFMSVAVHKSDIEDRLILDVFSKRKGAYRQQGGYPIEISLEPATLNGSGVNIYAPELLRSDDFIFILPNLNEKMDWNLWEGGQTSPTSFSGGFRGNKPDGILLAEGWEQFKQFKKYPADIYFDVTADPNIPTILAGLRKEIPYRRFLFPLPMGLKANEVTSTNPARPNNRGLCAFWGAGYISNPFEPTGFLLSTLMGEVAARYADARVLSFGGRAVAWGDENGVGGQLNQGRIIKFLYDATQDEMANLDKNRVNPIILNELFGPIVASRRTTDTSDTDYSYSDYSMIVDYCVERILNEVLPFQLIKFNDEEHRSIVKMKAELILNPLLQPPNNVIRNFAIKCDEENNNDEVLARQEFVLSVAIQVTPKSEFIHFNFINTAQTGKVEEDVR